MKDGGDVAYIEHENKSNDVNPEIDRKLFSTPSVPLKVVITYKSENHLSDLEELTKDIQRRIREKHDGAEWILIGDVRPPYPPGRKNPKGSCCLDRLCH